MTIMRHIIKKQIIELSLDKRLNYFNVQQQVSDRYWNEIVPLLEKSFDAISSEDRVIEIDRFELDLGVLSEKELRGGEFIQEIRKKIEDKIAVIVNPQSSQYSVRTRDRKLSVFDQWLYYMDHGHLAWNSDKPGDKWRSDVLETIQTDQGSRLTLRNRIVENPDFLKRLVNLHDDGFLNSITENFSSVKTENFSEVIGELIQLNRYLIRKKIIPDQESEGTLRTKLWRKVLNLTAKESTRLSVRKDLIVSFVSEKKLIIKIPAKAAESFPQILPVLNEFMGDISIQQKKVAQKIEKARNDIRLSNYEEAMPVAEQITKSDWNKLDEEGIFIVNAGTVLLHPFLKMFFNRIGIVKDNSFIDGNAQITGIYLLQYLATGRIEAEEYELTLYKILCALPLETPVEQIKKPDPGFIVEADLLIESVLAQWSILKNTSGAGLREGFLQRPGKLFKKNGNIYLRVEKSSIDVLLDYLPWNLGIIMLPWMKDVLRVEWR